MCLSKINLVMAWKKDFEAGDYVEMGQVKTQLSLENCGVFMLLENRQV